MKLVGFNFYKISIDKFKDSFTDLKIDTKIDIAQVHDVKSSMFASRDEMVGVKFTYIVDYSPDVAKIELAGNVVLSTDAETIKKVLEEWKDKKMPEEFRITLFNIILRKSNIKALELEDDLNLPLHIPLPSVKKEDQQQTDNKPEGNNNSQDGSN